MKSYIFLKFRDFVWKFELWVLEILFAKEFYIHNSFQIIFTITGNDCSINVAPNHEYIVSTHSFKVVGALTAPLPTRPLKLAGPGQQQQFGQHNRKGLFLYSMSISSLIGFEDRFLEVQGRGGEGEGASLKYLRSRPLQFDCHHQTQYSAVQYLLRKNVTFLHLGQLYFGVS